MYCARNQSVVAGSGPSLHSLHGRSSSIIATELRIRIHIFGVFTKVEKLQLRIRIHIFGVFTKVEKLPIPPSPKHKTLSQIPKERISGIVFPKSVTVGNQ